MAITERTRSREGQTPQPLRSRLAWMLILWLAGVASLGAVSLVLRLWLKVPSTP